MVRYFRLGRHSPFMRYLLLSLFLLVHMAPMACTAFKVTKDSRTFVGNNEDSWSINAQVRFVQGHNGDYGAIYFDHFNGHPFRQMGPQLGMNEVGLVFDGLTIQPKHTTPVPGLKQVQFDDLLPLLMRTCASVHEAATLMRTYDFSWLTRSMLFIADRNGDYLIVESDTMILGNDPSYAVGNWRMGTCSDPATIPIPRLQAGRQLLLTGSGASLEEAEEVLSTMTVCRPKMGEGTLFSVLFDPTDVKAHLYFYHDFNQRVTFDLKEELAKGDRVTQMTSLFTPNAEYGALQAYITPFHRRWLWWGLAGLAVLAVFAGLFSLVSVLRGVVALLRRRPAGPLLPAVLMGIGSAVVIGLVGVLLLNEGVYFFGLGDLHPLLAWLPLALCLGWGLLVRSAWTEATGRRWTRFSTAVVLLPFLALLGYWGMLWP